jgi:hypothetical protein
LHQFRLPGRQSIRPKLRKKGELLISIKRGYLLQKFSKSRARIKGGIDKTNLFCPQLAKAGNPGQHLLALHNTQPRVQLIIATIRTGQRTSPNRFQVDHRTMLHARHYRLLIRLCSHQINGRSLLLTPPPHTRLKQRQRLIIGRSPGSPIAQQRRKERFSLPDHHRIQRTIVRKKQRMTLRRLRTTHPDPQRRPSRLQQGSQPQGALNIPEIDGATDNLTPALKNRLHQMPAVQLIPPQRRKHRPIKRGLLTLPQRMIKIGPRKQKVFTRRFDIIIKQRQLQIENFSCSHIRNNKAPPHTREPLNCDLSSLIPYPVQHFTEGRRFVILNGRNPFKTA